MRRPFYCVKKKKKNYYRVENHKNCYSSKCHFSTNWTISRFYNIGYSAISGDLPTIKCVDFCMSVCVCFSATYAFFWDKTHVYDEWPFVIFHSMIRVTSFFVRIHTSRANARVENNDFYSDSIIATHVLTKRIIHTHTHTRIIRQLSISSRVNPYHSYPYHPGVFHVYMRKEKHIYVCMYRHNTNI